MKHFEAPRETPDVSRAALEKRIGKLVWFTLGYLAIVAVITPDLVVSAILTIFLYIISPCIYLASKGQVSKWKANNICIINSIVVWCSYQALYFWIDYMSGYLQEANPYPAFLFFFINRWLLTDKSILPAAPVAAASAPSTASIKAVATPAITQTNPQVTTVPSIQKTFDRTRVMEAVLTRYAKALGLSLPELLQAMTDAADAAGVATTTPPPTEPAPVLYRYLQIDNRTADELLREYNAYADAEGVEPLPFGLGTLHFCKACGGLVEDGETVCPHCESPLVI